MVGEFPELQGIMGEIYALKQGDSEVAQAIRRHYMPTEVQMVVPSSVPGALLAVADKLDTFLSFSCWNASSSSNDPYALVVRNGSCTKILAALIEH